MTSTDDTGNIATIQSSQDDTSPKVMLILHQFPGIELTSPVYAARHATCYLPPDQSVDFGSTTQAGFNIDLFFWGESIGILMYKLQRKDIDQSNEEAISSKDEATCTQFFIIWKINSSKEFYMVSWLIEHDKDCVWDEDRLLELTKYYELYDIHVFAEKTYLMHDNTVLMTSLSMTHEEECYKIVVTISEGSVKKNTRRIPYIGLDR
jgi:hypothetical protein